MNDPSYTASLSLYNEIIRYPDKDGRASLQDLLYKSTKFLEMYQETVKATQTPNSPSLADLYKAYGEYTEAARNAYERLSYLSVENNTKLDYSVLDILITLLETFEDSMKSINDEASTLRRNAFRIRERQVNRKYQITSNDTSTMYEYFFTANWEAAEKPSYARDNKKD